MGNNNETNKFKKNQYNHRKHCVILKKEKNINNIIKNKYK
jgi:hypothetical protein